MRIVVVNVEHGLRGEMPGKTRTQITVVTVAARKHDVCTRQAEFIANICSGKQAPERAPGQRTKSYLALTDIDWSEVPGVQGDDFAFVTHLGKNRRKIKESAKAVLYEVFVGVEAFYEEYYFQRNLSVFEDPWSVRQVSIINTIIA